MDNAAHRRRLIWTASVGAVGLLAVISLYVTRADPQPLSHPVPGAVDSITIEVFNGAAINGLARATTLRLRRLGYDVVFYGTARDSIWQTTEVIARRGDTAAARRVVDALGFGEVKEQADASRLLDVSVFLGRDASDSLGVKP